jgi:hypothetical protein
MPTPLQQVEQNLSEIAVAQISEKNPSLLNYYLGFDIIDKNDDGTRAAGIMGFKFGGQLVYIPVFFLNGKVKGMEVMYLKNSDTFVANNEQWVNYISGQNPEDIGQPTVQQQVTEGEATNSLRIFSRPPASANSKAASLENFYDITVDDFIDVEMAVSEPQSDLVDFLKRAGYENYKDFIKTALDKPELFTYISKFYDLDDIKIEFSDANKNSTKVAEIEDGDPKVKLIKSEDLMDKNASHISNEEKSEIIKRGYKIDDSRDELDKSDLYLGDFRKEFSQVTDSGLYEILNHNGELVNALVFVSPRSIESGHSPEKYDFSRNSCVPQAIIDPDNGNFEWSKEQVYYRSGTNIITDLEESDKSKILEKTGKDVKSCAVGKKYFLIDHKLSLYGPFTVTNKLNEKSKTTIIAEQDYIPECSCSCWGQKIYLRVIEKEHGLPEFSKGNVVFVPKCCRVIEIKEKDLYGDHQVVPGVTEKSIKKNEIKDIKPGDFRTLQNLLTSRDAEPISVSKSASFDFNITFNRDSISFRDRPSVILDLMSRGGLNEECAEKLASEIFDNKKSSIHGWVLPRKQKMAYPSVDVPSGAAGANRDGTPIQTQQTQRTEMMPASPGPRNPTDMDIGLWNQITDEDLDFLERASDSNSRQVFDPAMIGVLVRTSRSQSIVQDYIPELVDNLDRMCRLLLLFYWHNSDFSEEYGIDEMADFEDLILSTIKSTAKVVLFLKQRAVESSAGQTDVLE